MKRYKLCLSLLFLVMLISCSTTKTISVTPQQLSGIDLIFTGEQVADSIFVTISPIPKDTTLFKLDYFNAINNGRTAAYPVKNGFAHIPLDSVASTYNIRCNNYSLSRHYMRNTDHVTLKVNNLNTSSYVREGGIYDSKIPYSNEYYKLKKDLSNLDKSELSSQQIDSLSREMKSLIDKIMSVSEPEAATRFVSILDEDLAPYAFERLPKGSDETLYYTYACANRNVGIRNQIQENEINMAVETCAPIPEIPIKCIDGSEFKLSSLRGKWIVVDFWASWCAPCRKGFENMKKLYENNIDKLEVVAIACGDQTDTWNNMVRKLELPWINLLVPSPSTTNETVGGFPVPAYPTKIIIDTESRIRDFTVGESEEFYEKLEELLKDN